VTITLLVTRPAAQAAVWVERLRAQGLDAQALPLMAIEPLADDTALRDAWRALEQHALAMFVSPNAVACFFAARPHHDHAAWPALLRAGATGPGTLEALVQAGVPRALCVAPHDAPFDSAALWAQLRGERWQGRSVLIVRGDGGRDEFAQSLRDAGAQVTFVQAYRRAVPRWSAAECALAATAVAAPAQHLWLLSSGEAIDHLTALLPGAQWRDARALASHPRIAERARAAGFGQVIEAPPTIDAVRSAVASLESSSP
jgi:uroporphyrinogen-III synthase